MLKCDPATYGLSMFFSAHLRLPINTILGLQHGLVFHHHDHAVLRVLVVGVCVSVDLQTSWTMLTIDDGTGLAVCLQWAADSHLQTPPSLGALVTIKARLALYNRQTQLVASHVFVETDPNAELLHWIDCKRLERLYRMPRIVSQKITKPASMVRCC